jgi:hypothetical protein
VWFGSLCLVHCVGWFTVLSSLYVCWFTVLSSLCVGWLLSDGPLGQLLDDRFFFGGGEEGINMCLRDDTSTIFMVFSKVM